VLAKETNSTAVTTVTATEPENSATTGALAFAAAPNFEVRTDAGANGVYDVIVRASDGANADTQAIAVTILNVNEAPVITSNGAGATAGVTASENSNSVTTVTSTDPENTARIYSIIGGADAAKFTINATTGVLSFVAAPNFESPTDAGANNVYDVIVRASDGSLVDSQALAIQVANVDETVAITSNGGGNSASVSADENVSVVLTVSAVDPESGAPAYAIAGGADAALFAIDAATGELSFVDAPDFEWPADADGDNVYEVVVSATDGGVADTQAISVAIGDVDEGAFAPISGGGFETVGPAAFGPTEGQASYGGESAATYDAFAAHNMLTVQFWA
jgi:serralysin